MYKTYRAHDLTEITDPMATCCRYNVMDYGAVPDIDSEYARGQNQSAVANAIAAMGPAPSPNPPGFVYSAFAGGTLYFPRGSYYFNDTIVLERALEIRGEGSNQFTWAYTRLCFPKNKTGIYAQFVSDSSVGGRSDGGAIRNIALKSGTWTDGSPIRPWSRWSPSTAYAIGAIVIPAQWSKWGYAFECTTAGTSGTSDAFFPGRDMRLGTATIVAAGTTYSDGSVTWTLRYIHGIDVRSTLFTIENVFINTFAGNGINIVTDATIPGHGGSNLPYVRLATLDNVGGHGVAVHGNDVNAGTLQSINAIDIGGWGIMADPGLNLTIRDCHTRGCEGGTPYWIDRCSGDGLYAEGGQGAIHLGGIARLDNVIAGGSEADGFTFDYRQTWSTGATITQGQAIKPTVDNGYYYVAQNAGTTHATTEPTWPTRQGSTVADNGITWLRYGLSTTTINCGDSSGANGMLLGVTKARNLYQRTTGHQYPVAMRFAYGPSPIIWQVYNLENADTQELQYDRTVKAWYHTSGTSNQLVWWPDGSPTSPCRAYLPYFPQGVGLGRAGIAGAAYVNSSPKIVSATRAPNAGEGTWQRGDVVMHNNPAVGSPIGWTCTVSGDPGTWVAWANL